MISFCSSEMSCPLHSLILFPLIPLTNGYDARVLILHPLMMTSDDGEEVKVALT